VILGIGDRKWNKHSKTRQNRANLSSVRTYSPQTWASVANKLGITAEARVMDRKNTGFPTVEQRNRELLLGGADMCIAVHNRIAACPRTLDCVQQALQDGIPTYEIEYQHTIPRLIKRGDSRLR
jgi:hypothetical protein